MGREGEGGPESVRLNMSYKVEKIEAMKRKEGGQEEALNILKRIAKQVREWMTPLRVLPKSMRVAGRTSRRA